MSGSDDVFDIEDLRALLGRATGGTGTRRVAVVVVLAVVGASLALALVPHTLGAVGADAVDTGGGVGFADVDGEEAQQRYQNYLTNVTFLFAPAVLAVLGALAAFAGAVRTAGSRPWRVAAVALAAGVGVALGYVLFVLVGHLAYGETTQGFVVEEYPVTLRFGAIARNALSLGAAAGVGGALAGVAGTFVDAREPEPTVEAPAGVAAEEGESDDERTDVESERGDEARVAAAEDGGDPVTDGDADDDGVGPARAETSGPASDYRDAGPTGRSDAPRYDPDDRDWDGSGDD